MGALEDFKSEVDKFIQFMNDRLKTYHLDTDEEYDTIIDNLVVEYYRNGNRVLVFDDMEWYEETLSERGGKNPYSMIHCYEDDCGQPRGRACPREHTCFIDSADGRYDATITTIATLETPYLYKKIISTTGLFIPQFFLESIRKCATGKYLYYNEFKDIREYDPFR
jgi:hypothetical protein